MNVRAVSLNGHVPTTLIDQLELGYLSNLQDQRAVMQRIRDQTRLGMESIAGNRLNGQPLAAGTTPLAGSETDADDMGIVNRSPTTNNHNHYPAPANPWPWIALIVLALSALGAGTLWWLSSRPQTPAPKIGTYGLGLDDLKVY